MKGIICAIRGHAWRSSGFYTNTTLLSPVGTWHRCWRCGMIEHEPIEDGTWAKFIADKLAAEERDEILRGEDD